MSHVVKAHGRESDGCERGRISDLAFRGSNAVPVGVVKTRPVSIQPLPIASRSVRYLMR